MHQQASSANAMRSPAGFRGLKSQYMLLSPPPTPRQQLVGCASQHDVKEFLIEDVSDDIKVTLNGGVEIYDLSPGAGAGAALPIASPGGVPGDKHTASSGSCHKQPGNTPLFSPPSDLRAFSSPSSASGLLLNSDRHSGTGGEEGGSFAVTDLDTAYADNRMQLAYVGETGTGGWFTEMSGRDRWLG